VVEVLRGSATAAAGAAGDEHRAVREDGGVVLAAREVHGRSLRPRRVVAEVDQLRRRGRGGAPADVNYLVGLVEHRGCVVPLGIVPVRDSGPRTPVGDVEGERLL